MIKLNRPPCPDPIKLQTDYKSPVNKSALIASTHGKCMYCESNVVDIAFGDVEHIKPKSAYPQLKYDWDNLGFSCTKCNNAKREKYNEDCPYINPYKEDPGQHFIAEAWFIGAKQGSERATVTINDIDLNRTPLVESRREKINQLKSAVNECFRTSDQNLQNQLLSLLIDEGNSNQEYSFFKKVHLSLHGLI